MRYAAFQLEGCTVLLLMVMTRSILNYVLWCVVWSIHPTPLKVLQFLDEHDPEFAAECADRLEYVTEHTHKQLNDRCPWLAGLVECQPGLHK